LQHEREHLGPGRIEFANSIWIKCVTPEAPFVVQWEETWVRGFEVYQMPEERWSEKASLANGRSVRDEE